MKKSPSLPLPSEISELDAARLSSAHERFGRLDAESALLFGRLQQAKAAAEQIRDEVWKKYKVGQTDTVDTETRKITRT